MCTFPELVFFIIMEWNDEKCLNLIDIYENTPILWNPKDKNYYKKPLKEDAWAEIGGAMNTSGANCKQKMVNLLASYRREKMKIKKSRGTGTGTDDVYDSKWFAFNALEFLKDRDKPRKGLTTESIADNNNAESTEDENTDVPTNEPLTKKPKTDGKLQLLKEAFGILKSAANRPPPQSDNQNPELGSFCDFIIQKMKNYSSHTKNAVQQDICQIIFRADQGFYDYPPEFGYTPQSSPSASTSSRQTPSTFIHSSVGCTIPSPAIPSTTQADLRNSDSEAFSPMSDYSELDITELV